MYVFCFVFVFVFLLLLFLCVCVCLSVVVVLLLLLLLLFLGGYFQKAALSVSELTVCVLSKLCKSAAPLIKHKEAFGSGSILSPAVAECGWLTINFYFEILTSTELSITHAWGHRSLTASP